MAEMDWVTKQIVMGQVDSNKPHLWEGALKYKGSPIYSATMCRHCGKPSRSIKHIRGLLGMWRWHKRQLRTSLQKIKREGV